MKHHEAGQVFVAELNLRGQLAVPEDLECERGPHAAIWKQALWLKEARALDLVRPFLNMQPAVGDT